LKELKLSKFVCRLVIAAVVSPVSEKLRVCVVNVLTAAAGAAKPIAATTGRSSFIISKPSYFNNGTRIHIWRPDGKNNARIVPE
jgi:hypothetical protein